jgi:uncharacterized protein (TIGR02145 family)
MKKVSLFLALLVTAVISFSAFVRVNKTSQVTPNEVTIGKQVWMSENLNVDKFRNGNPIPQAKTDEEWLKAGKNGKPAWCYYNNDPENGMKYGRLYDDTANGDKYGKLYNWFAVNDLRGLAPVGWHIPSDEEWTQLTNQLSSNKYVVGEKMKSTSGWRGNPGTNESGFSGMPGGYRYYNGPFSDFGDKGHFWSSSKSGLENGEVIVFERFLNYSGECTKRSNDATSGLSVRLIKD